MNVEVEIKFKINDSEFQILKRWLEDNASNSVEYMHTDTYFEPNSIPYIYLENKTCKADKWLRIREESGGNSICFKFWHRDKGIDLFADEYETKIESVDTMKLIIKSLDYKPIITVRKIRESWSYDSFEISIDLVEELGRFVEIEYRNSSAEKVISDKRKLYELLKMIGINDYVEYNLGYPMLLLNK